MSSSKFSPSSVKSSQRSQISHHVELNQIVYNLDILLYKLKDEDYDYKAGTSAKVKRADSFRSSSCSRIMPSNSPDTAPKLSVDQQIEGVKEKPLIKSEFEKASDLKRLLNDEVEKGKQDYFNRQRLLMGLNTGPLKRTRDDIRSIEAYLGRIPFFTEL